MLESRLDHSKADLLGQLTAKEREVLDLVAARHSSKEIARQLGLSLNGVEWRLSKAREKLHARDRNDLVRTYLALLGDCDRTPVDPIPVSEGPSPTLAPTSEPSGGRFTFQDAASFSLPAPWEVAAAPVLSEVLDRRFGRLWRVLAIPFGALVLALLALALIAMAQVLGTLI